MFAVVNANICLHIDIIIMLSQTYVQCIYVSIIGL